MLELMVNAAYLFVYRTYIAWKRAVLDPVLRRWPGGQQTVTVVIKFFRQYFVSSREIWVQVRSGLAEGLWLQLRIPEEAGFWRGEHEPDIQREIARVACAGDIIYDVGAHLGSLALGAARIVGASSGGSVVAFDADPSNIERLKRNAARNQFEEALRPVHAALWSHANAKDIAFRRGAVNRSQGGVEADGQRPVLPGQELIQVPVITLDQFIAEGNPPPQLVKIDVEGGECEVLRGGSRLFAAQRPLLIVEVHHQLAYDTLNAWLAEYRYSSKWKIPPECFPRHLLAWPAERAQPFLD